MNVLAMFVAGTVATIVLTVIVEYSRAAGFSRISFPYILGTMVTPDRRKAPLIGSVIHLGNGLVFAFGYALFFEMIGKATWWIGALLGVVQTAIAFLSIDYIAAVHPRMATDQDGPEARAALQPPGFLALNYGTRTPLVGLIAHLAYGSILGAFL
jgi:hypothetical protein